MAKRRTFGTVFRRGSTFFVQYLDAPGRRVKEKAGGTRGLADRLLAKRREDVETSRVTGERPVRPLGFRELVDRWETVTRGTWTSPGGGSRCARPGPAVPASSG